MWNVLLIIVNTVMNSCNGWTDFLFFLIGSSSSTTVFYVPIHWKPVNIKNCVFTKQRTQVTLSVSFLLRGIMTSPVSVVVLAWRGKVERPWYLLILKGNIHNRSPCCSSLLWSIPKKLSYIKVKLALLCIKRRVLPMFTKNKQKLFHLMSLPKKTNKNKKTEF